MARKRKVRVKKIARLLVLLIIAAIFVVFLKLMFKETINMSDMYLASNGKEIVLYDTEYNEAKKVIRGEKVSAYDKSFTNNDIEYKKIKYDDNEYYILPSNLVSNYEESVQEKNMYVRTPVTIYKDSNGAD